MPTVTLNTTETTFVSSAQPNNNFSFYPLLFTGTDISFQNCISYLKFALPSLPVTAVDSAILQLSVIVKTGVTSSPVLVNRVTSPLNTSTVTYNTQPTFTATSSFVNVNTSDLYTAVQIDVTTLVNQWLDGTFTNNGFALTNSDGITLVEFATNNIVYEPYFPRLVLTYTITPPSNATIRSGADAPTCSIGNNGDLYVETANGNLFFKQSQPTPPIVREIPAPTGNTIQVGSTRLYTTIQSAIDAASNGDLLLLDAETFVISSTIMVNKSVTIEGQGIASTEVITTTSSVVSMFSITVSDVVISNMKIVQNFPSVLSVESVITVNNFATGIYIDNCEISVCELGISVIAEEFQITNCNFTYAPLASLNNSYYYILISSTSGTSIIDNNTFVSASGNTRCRFIIITNVTVSSGTLQGKLLISNNSQAVSPFTLRHLFLIEEFVGTDFEVFINNNTTVNEGNVPVLFFNANNDIFSFIEVVGNNIQNTAGKGLIGIDGSSAGTTDIFNSGNIIANQFFTTGWASATVPASFIVGYNTEAIPIAPELPLATCYWLPITCNPVCDL